MSIQNRARRSNRLTFAEALEDRTMFNAGSPDPTFLPNSGQYFPGPLYGVAAVASDSAGKILIGGYVFSGTGPSGVGLERLNQNGSLDTTFGVNGQVQFNFIGSNQSVVIEAIAVQSNGKILVAGFNGTIVGNYRVPQYGPEAPFVARLNNNGTLDTTFGSGGKVAADFVDISGIAALPSGNIIYGGDNAPVGGSATKFEAVGLYSNGSTNSSYGSHGVASVNFNDTVSASSFTVESNGDALICGTGSKGADLARFTAAGLADSSFGSSGRVTLTNAMNYAYAAVQTNGQVLVEGGINNSQTNWLERLNTNGWVDTTFGTSGHAVLPLNYGAGPVAVEANGDILASGATPSGVAIARYLSNGKLDTSYGTNGVAALGIGLSDVFYAATTINIQSSGRVVVADSINEGDPITGIGIVRFLGDHAVLTGGQSAATTGTTTAADSRLIGTVAAAQTLNFTYGSGSSAVHGQVQEWVEKETVSGTLDFYYRIVTSSGSAGSIASLLASNFAGFTTYVDYRPDSNGTIAPVIASRSSDQKSITFTFQTTSNEGNGLVTAGKSSYALFIKTNATHYNLLGKVVLNNTITLDGYEPTT